MLWYANRFDVLSHAAAIAPEGLVLEFGVATGATITHLANAPNLRARKLYGFDSFCGLPERWGVYPIGHFACERPAVPANVELVVGEFAYTLAPFLAAVDGPAALIHLDADLYSSTATVLDALTPRVMPGTVIAMDEYFILTDHEQQAFHDWLLKHDKHCHAEARSIEQLVVVMD